MNDNRYQAISDCKYALSLSETAFNQHILNWTCKAYSDFSEGEMLQEDQEYLLTLKEIQDKLHTDQCLLTQEGE